ncbi:hypothetical protein ISCGN_007130 [Ixodes scapularis]
MADDVKQQETAKFKSKDARMDAGWHVPFICAIVICFTSIGVANSGYFFVTWMEELTTDREAASWPRSVMGVMMHMSGLIYWLLHRWLSAFHITLIGTLLACIGMMISSFAPSMPFVTLTYGVIYGTGLGMTSFSLSMLIMMCFDKYRSIANGLYYLGICLPAFAFPPLLLVVEDEYGFRSTVFLCGALAMNATPLAMVLKESSKIRRRTNTIELEQLPASHSEKNEKGSSEITMIDNTSGNPCSKMQYLFRDMVKLLRKPAFYVCAIYAVFVEYVGTSIQSTIVDYANDKGLSLSEAESIVAYTAPFTFLGLLVIPIIADRGCVKRSNLVMLSLFLMGALILALPACSTFLSLFVVNICLDLVSTFAAMMIIVVTMDYLGVDRVPTCAALKSLLIVPLLLCGPMITGKPYLHCAMLHLLL